MQSLSQSAKLRFLLDLWKYAVGNASAETLGQKTKGWESRMVVTELKWKG